MKSFNKFFLVGLSTVLLTACGSGSEEESNNGDGNEDTSWTDVESSGSLVVGTSGTYAPITYIDENNELTGFEVELVREVADRLGLDIEFSTMDFDGILPALRNGQIDVAAHDFAITEERLDTFDFAEPHKYSYGSAVVREEDEDQFSSAHDLEGIDVALGSLTSNYAIFADNIGANGTAYDGGTEAILRDVISGNQRAYLNDYLVLQRTLEEFGDDRLVLAEDVKYHATESALAVLKGNEALQEQISNTILELIEEGVVSELSVEYLGEDVSQPTDNSEIVSLEG
ncbi:transporter substrate-binding domain-containing protein [Geomicrobium sp. JCM 19038]|uniref:transporter substrate-binding domain-containing protein n=1 Tax=Geomicrobium sp. JCM 19038 TaxID=1460635 RepID=UPI00045F11C4|nr:transporter substrate-binding domain-containing protein [Geomicrobium sp. JCM 19038]GAK06868.1 amino acid ABC transporter, periplasmic amino acid-binding protein [Geomicrobium sp. JCM 19038]